MGGGDEVRAAADQEVWPRVNTGVQQLGDLAFENDRIDDDAVADHILGARAENATGDGVEDVFLAVKNQRVSGVRTALKTCDDVVLRGEDIDNFAFSFIAPLEAQEHIYLHVNSFLLRLIRIAFTKVQKCSILLDFP